MIKIHIFHTGSVIVDRAIPYKDKNPLAVTGLLRGEDKKMTLPVSCYLIEHPKGNILIDAGWDSKYVTEKPHRFFGLLNSICTPIIREGESIDCKLQKLGLKPVDIDYVFFSHMDFDHISGLRLVKDAQRIMASKEEIADSKKLNFRYEKSDWEFTSIIGFEYEKTGIGPVGKSYDVFGDGSITLVSTPGHSNGLFSVKITNGEKYVILASDSVYTQKSIKEHIIPGFTVDAGLAKKSVEYICKCVLDSNCILVAPNHDPVILEQTIEL